MSIIDQILKPFSERLQNLEKIYEENSKVTSINIDFNEKLKQLIFKEVKKPIYNKKYDFDNLPMPEKTNIIDLLQTNINDDKFAKKIIEYRLLEIKKQLLVFEELVIQYIHIDLSINKMNVLKNEIDKQSMNKMKENIMEHLNYIVSDDNIHIFNKIYCKNNLLNQYFTKMNE